MCFFLGKYVKSHLSSVDWLIVSPLTLHEISAIDSALLCMSHRPGFPIRVRGPWVSLGLYPGLLDDGFCHGRGPSSPAFTYFYVFQVFLAILGSLVLGINFRISSSSSIKFP